MCVAVPGGGQLASARKPALLSVSTGGSSSIPFSTPFNVRSKNRSSSGWKFAALGVACGPWNM